MVRGAAFIYVRLSFPGLTDELIEMGASSFRCIESGAAVNGDQNTVHLLPAASMTR